MALVTGGGSGIGRASAIAFAREGARVAVLDIARPGADVTVERIRDQGGSAEAFQLDVSSDASVSACFAALDRSGFVADVVMNCAGVALGAEGDSGVHEIPEAIWDRTMAINLKGTYLVCKNAIARLVERGMGGSVINIASRAAINGTTHNAYSASKGGVAALSRSIGITYAAQGIRCNALAPGPIDTAMIASTLSDVQARAKRMETVPAGRAGTPEEVAALAVFLASDESAYITATLISIDGGASAI